MGLEEITLVCQRGIDSLVIAELLGENLVLGNEVFRVNKIDLNCGKYNSYDVISKVLFEPNHYGLFLTNRLPIRRFLGYFPFINSSYTLVGKMNNS